MVVGIKDAAKLVGISVMACCAVLVCTMFLNYNMDIVGVKEEITSEQVMIFYDAQVSTAKVVSAVSGGCLLITSVIMLLFYIKHYIDTHRRELGILKALGYSDFKIAKNFWVFGLSVLLGTAPGFCGAFLIMPIFYRVQNEDKILPEIVIHFHPALFVYMVIVPAVVFAVLAIFYACCKLKKPVLLLLRDSLQTSKRVRKHSRVHKPDHRSFIENTKRAALKSKKTLAFFVVFSSFCFSSMTQMSLGIRELASVMMSIMMLLIGVILAGTILFLAITTVIRGNTKTIAMMKVFGYSQKECRRALLGGYRPLAYVGFAIGTGYQYVLLRVVVDVVFREMEGIPAFEFDFTAMLISLAAFIVIYELVMFAYSERLKKISVKEIMFE